jgi:PAS domain S-box-containing protein
MQDNDGNVFGVLAFDMYLSTIANYLENMQLMNEGYAVLLDSDMRFIIHPNKTVIGVQMGELQPEKAAVMRESGELNNYSYISLAGEDSILFSKKLFNGWYLYLSSPRSDYYNDVNSMFWILLLAGFAATVVLCSVLTLTYRAKARSDELKDATQKMMNEIEIALDETKAILDNMDMMICVSDLEYNLLFMNKRLADTFNMNREESVGRKCYEAIRGIDKPCSFCRMEELIPQKDSFPSIDFENVYDEQAKIWISGTDSIIRWVDGSTVLFRTFMDTTEAKNTLV